MPAAFPVINIPSIKLNKTVDIFDFREKINPVISDTPQTFESLGQGSGYVMYSKHFDKSEEGTLTISGLRDFAIVYVNGKNIAELNRYFKNYSCKINIPANGSLAILVENMGRINYGAEIIHNLKGIISPVTIDSHEIKGEWKMYKLPMDEEPVIKLFGNVYHEDHPVIYSGIFNLYKTGDTYVDMRKWGKGIVFINGHNLGRYWNSGPQQTLYLPGCWLKKGKNTVTIFEELNTAQHTEISAIKTPVLDELK